MKISISCKREGSDFAAIAAAGFDGVDFPFYTYRTRENHPEGEYEAFVLDQYRQIQNAGLCVCQCHLTYFQPEKGAANPYLEYEEFEFLMLPIFKSQIRLAGRMNCRTAVIHSYYTVDREASVQGNLKLFEKLIPTLEENKVILSIENLYGKGYSNVHLTTAEDLLFYPRYFSSPYLGVCLDAGHAVSHEQDPIEMLRKLGRNLTAVHLHGNIAKRDFHSLPYLLRHMDKVDWTEFYRVLTNETGYEGSFNLETGTPAHLSPEAEALYYRLAYQIANDITNSL